MQIIIFCCRWPIRHGHAPYRLPAQDNVSNSPHTPQPPAPPPTLLTSMGKWANGKLKVEHVAAAQRGSRREWGGGQCWPSVLRSVLYSQQQRECWCGKGGEVCSGGGQAATQRWHVNSLCELLRCAELVCGFGVSLEC